MTKHHVVPRSRGGKRQGKNIVTLPQSFHSHWHGLFGNLTAQEAVTFIKAVFSGNGAGRKTRWTGEELAALRREIQGRTKQECGQAS